MDEAETRPTEKSPFLKAIVITWVTIAFLLAIGVISYIYLKPRLTKFGFQFNWIWPILCLFASDFFDRGTQGMRTPGLYPRSFGRSLIVFIVGIGIGVGLQAVFFGLGMRQEFHFQGFTPLALAFQAYVAWAEERFFRGSLQAYLSRRSFLTLGIGRSFLSSLLVSIPLALLHGFQPVILEQGVFAAGVCMDTFLLSFFAGLFFGQTGIILAPFGVHLGHSLTSAFF